MSSELPVVAKVEVFVRIEPSERDTTEYLLSAEADRKHFLQAMEDLKDKSSYIYINPDEL